MEVEAGAARLKELSRLSEETAAARRENEKACASTRAEEAEAIKAAEAAAAAASAVAALNGKSSQSHPGTAPRAAPPSTDANESGTDGPAHGSEVTHEESPAVAGVLDSKRPATTTVTSDPKRRRRSREAGVVIDPLSGGVEGGNAGNARNAGNAAGGGGRLSRTGTRGSATGLGLVPHPVFARREQQAAKEAEASAPSAEDVLGMAREANELADKIRACEEKLEAANTVRDPHVMNGAPRCVRRVPSK